MQFYHYFEDKENIYSLLEYCSRRVSVDSWVSELADRKPEWCLDYILSAVLAVTVN